MEFPEFWYESNACWGGVKSIEDLKEMFRLQLSQKDGINNVHDFLDKSLRGIPWNHTRPAFGTRREHRGGTLKSFLESEGVLEEFLSEINKQNFLSWMQNDDLIKTEDILLALKDTPLSLSEKISELSEQKSENQTLINRLDYEIFSQAKKNREAPNFVLMHPKTWKGLFVENINMGGTYMNLHGTQLNYKWLKVFRSLDVEEGKFVIW